MDDRYQKPHLPEIDQLALHQIKENPAFTRKKANISTPFSISEESADKQGLETLSNYLYPMASQNSSRDMELKDINLETPCA